MTLSDDLGHIFGEADPGSGGDPERTTEPPNAAPPTPGSAGKRPATPEGTAELAALAAHDANELLRFVESAMTAEESATFLEEVRSRDPEGASRLERMRADHNLLRTAVDLPATDLDLLGPVRAQIARAELVQVQAEIGGEAADPTAFMTRSVASRVRRRRFRRQRNLLLVILAGVAGVSVGATVAWYARRPVPAAAKVDPIPAESPSRSVTLADFALVVPVSDVDRAESAIAMLAMDHDAVVMRNRASTAAEPEPPQPAPIVGTPATGLPDRWRSDLGRRGFSHAILVPAEAAPTVIAGVGEIADRTEEGGTSARLVPSSSEDAIAELGRDAWRAWPGQDVTGGRDREAGAWLVVPVAVVPSPRPS